MDKRISLQQYRNIDLGIMAVVLLITQVLISLATNVWFKWEMYVVSPVAVITALVMMRWGPWAGIHAVLGGLVYTVMAGGNWQHYLIFGLGNLLSLLALLMLKLFGKERVRTSVTLTLVFAFCVQMCMLLGRALVALVLGYGPAECLAFITTDLLNVLFTMVILWIARRVDGLYEDQKHYLLRIQEEK